MSDTEEIELSKEERLEAARKKFEELKKKNKKKNKKGKKLKQTDDSKEDTPGAEDEADLLNDVMNDPEEKVEGGEEEEEEETKIENIKIEESPAEEHEREVEPANETELKPEETPQEETNTIVAETEKEKESTTPLEKDFEPIKKQEQTLEWLAADEDNTAKSWLDEIQEKPLASEEIVKDDSLEEIIAKQKIEILELKEENTDLKMNKFELMEKIESLESTIKKLNAKLNSRQIDRPLYQSDYNSELSLSPDHPPLFLSNQNSQQQTSGFIKTSSFQNFGEDYTDSAGDLRDRLLKWKDWQVDMRNWKSIAGGAIVEI